MLKENKCTSMTMALAQIPPGMTMPAPSGLSSHMRHAAASTPFSCEGRYRGPHRATTGPQLAKKNRSLNWSGSCLVTITVDMETPRGRWGPQWLWWILCHRECTSSFRPAWRVGRRAGSRWQCSSRSRAFERKKKWRRVERRRWCAPCCSGPVASVLPGC